MKKLITLAILALSLQANTKVTFDNDMKAIYGYSDGYYFVSNNFVDIRIGGTKTISQKNTECYDYGIGKWNKCQLNKETWDFVKKEISKAKVRYASN